MKPVAALRKILPNKPLALVHSWINKGFSSCPLFFRNLLIIDLREYVIHDPRCQQDFLM